MIQIAENKKYTSPASLKERAP